MQKLSGKTALITGGNSGIGLATAHLFVEQGARVAITGRDPASLEQAKQALGKDVLALRSDAGNVAEIAQLMNAVGEHFGQLDVLFLNAAAGNPAPMEFTTEAQFDAMSNISFKGVFFAIQKAVPWMRPGGSIIVTTSISNQVGAPNFSVYAACKAAARSLVQSASLELAHKGIRVNAISPGPKKWWMRPAPTSRTARQASALVHPAKSPMLRCTWLQTRQATWWALSWS
jgi:NAD(P)-dependent dehydrogenase (short-subunit alcohol dehydrogenase family)